MTPDDVLAEFREMSRENATEVTTAPTIAGCPHCARCER